MPDATRPATPAGDAVLFTSGATGASFSAGVIHAMLAVDRAAPRVTAGISMGAISAATLQRVYRELAAATPAQLEQKRWEWFRTYLVAVTQSPNDAIWNALPDPVDFYASTPPVRDLSTENLPGPLSSASADNLSHAAEAGRRHYYLLTRVGLWLADLPVRLSTLATIAVLFVRRKENYAGSWKASIAYYWFCTKAVVGVWAHLLLHPMTVDERAFEHTGHDGRHPLFGALWGQVALLTALLLLLLFAIGFALTAVASHWVVNPVLRILLGLLLEVLLLIVIATALTAYSKRPNPNSIDPQTGKRPTAFGTFLKRQGSRVFRQLDMATALLSPYEATRQLHDLFLARSPQPDPVTDVRLLIMCAALEATEQICLEEDMPLLDRLTAATAVPGIFPPQVVDTRFLAKSVLEARARANQPPLDHFHLIDGAAVRSNPIPAFFEWCKQAVHIPADAAIVNALEATASPHAALHVVYNVPTGYDGDASQAPPPEDLDIVSSAQLALALEKRRDTRQEVRQTIYTSDLHTIRNKVAATDSSRSPFILYADEIAPRTEIDNGSSLDPDPARLMRTVADGCRAALETLYQPEIQAIAVNGHASCATLLSRNGGRRRADANGVLAGLPEVCAACPGVLHARRQTSLNSQQKGVSRSFGQPGPGPHKFDQAAFAHLISPTPKVVFLGAGGVFRGAFHTGVIAAMKLTKLYPDLVVGTSVGALMGSALSHLTAGSEENEGKVLQALTDIFLHVDAQVALTRTLKNATKQLGTRARAIQLSPAELSRLVRRGSKHDPGYASTGAPPALIDALSSLFMIPHRETSEIASQFVAGHVADATTRFLKQMRKETLTSFDIKSAVMGVSLLEGEARKLMGQGTAGVDLTTFQPYHHPVPKHDGTRHPVSFFAVTSYLNARISLVLGRDFLSVDPTWNAVYAGLCSSAFPAVFAPRTEADLLPGRGRTDRFFADGGMFDNLPFLPAIEVLATAQTANPIHDPVRLQAVVKARAARPNLFIAAGLNAAPSTVTQPYDTLFKIRDRAASLAVESKVNTFVKGAAKTVKDLTVLGDSDLQNLTEDDRIFLNESVSAKVVCISPTDPAHINPTFAFCASTGLERERVQRSIADGCYQSLAAFASTPEVQAALTDRNTLIQVRTQASTGPGICPYFSWVHTSVHEVPCPFAQQAGTDLPQIYTVCSKDEAHRKNSNQRSESH